MAHSSPKPSRKRERERSLASPHGTSSLLGNVATLIRGVSFDGGEASAIARPGLIPILRAGNIGERLALDTNLIWVPESRLSNEQRMRPGDIAMCMSSGSATVVGKSAMLDADFAGSVGAFCAIIRTTERVRPRYLAAWLRSPAFRAWRNSHSRGASIQNLKMSSLSDVELFVPDLETQDLTIRTLGRRLETVVTMQREFKTQLVALDRLPRVLIVQTFDAVAA